MIVYGIPNCDSCRKTRKWLDRSGRQYRFHDLREDGIDRKRIRGWLDESDWKTLLNTRSTTWRSLPAGERDNVDEARAIDLMVTYPTLIKRPVIEAGKRLVVGFSAEKLADLPGN